MRNEFIYPFIYLFIIARSEKSRENASGNTRGLANLDGVAPFERNVTARGKGNGEKREREKGERGEKFILKWALPLTGPRASNFGSPRALVRVNRDSGRLPGDREGTGRGERE